MEILVVLAILGLSTALIMPSMSRMLDQATAHAVFFDFQKQVSDLRREASRTGVPIVLLDPAAAAALEPAERSTADEPDAPEAEPERVLQLREPWRYTLAPKLQIAEGGVCSATTANLIQEDRVVMQLTTTDGDCRFIRRY